MAIKLGASEYCGDTAKDVLAWRLSSYCDELERHGRQVKDLEAQIEDIRKTMRSIVTLRDRMAAALQLVLRDGQKEANP
jgi:hypothetical protein